MPNLTQCFFKLLKQHVNINKMKKLLLIILIIVVGNATASSLPDCPSGTSARLHNCFGTYTWTNGEKYVGEWKDDNMHGQGTYNYASGAKYVGELKDNKRNGQGTNTWDNGDTYVGEFKDDKQHGQGTHTYGENSDWAGDKYIGEYKDGKRHGQGAYTFANGRYQRGYYMNGVYVPTICENMGLTKGTESFGQCVLELIKEINEEEF